MTQLALGPNLASWDMPYLFTHEHEWAETRRKIIAFRFAREHVLAKAEGQYRVGKNTYPNLVKVGAFSKIPSYGLHTIIGVGAIGQDDCQAVGHARQTLEVIADVHNAGGRVDFLTIDSPWSFARAHCPDQHEEITASALAWYTKVIKDKYPTIGIGFVDGYPTWKGNDFARFALTLAQRSRAPAYVAVDVDRGALVETNWFARLWNRLLKREDAGFRQLRSEWKTIANLPNAVMLLWAEANSAAEYRPRILEWARFVRTLDPLPKLMIVESWSPSGEPHNLPESDPLSHTGLVLQVAQLFEEQR